MMRKTFLKNNSGLTLVELLIGVTIMAIIVIPLLRTFLVGAGTERKSRVYGEATQAAQNLSEQLQAADVKQVLNNAGLIYPGASYYTKSDGGYTATGTAAPAFPDGADKVYYMGISNYAYGGSKFDALLTLSVNSADPDNSADVAVSNPMGAYLDLSAADKATELALQAECSGLVAAPNLNPITRSITLNITKNESSADNYTVEALFDYNGTISYVINDKPSSLLFTHTERSTASVTSSADTASGSPIFSVYLFFDGYYKSDIRDEKILINNNTGSDVNVFLVNTNPASAPSTYSATIWYKYQVFDGDKPANELVFTNLPKDIPYYAFKTASLKKTLKLSGYLVEQQKLDRKFEVGIALYKAGEGFTGTPVLNIEAAKLS